MEGVDRLRAAATTEPGRLRIIGAALALLVVVFGAVSASQMDNRSAAADDVLDSSQRLSVAAADVYSSLADANTAASSGFLAGGQGTAESGERYDQNIERAATRLAEAATAAGRDSASARDVAELSRLLPEYSGLIAQARANNRQGYPLGGAYLRHANDKMQTDMLPVAERLYRNENERLRGDYDAATSFPWTATAFGVLALAALGWAQHRNYRRTNRVLNRGLVAGTTACALVLVWLVVGHTVARSSLDDSYVHGVRSLIVLNDARIASLKARGNENLTLVSRGAEITDSGEDAFDSAYVEEMDALSRHLATAADLADDRAGREPVEAAAGNMRIWQERHAVAREADTDGDYQRALDKTIGGPDEEPTSECFDAVDGDLHKALAHEQEEFEEAARAGRRAMNGLPEGTAALAVLGASGAVLGIGRRLSEYR